MRQEQLESVTTYTIGGFAITLPHYLEMLTSTMQFLTILFGFIVISIKLYSDLKKRFFHGDQDDDG